MNMKRTLTPLLSLLLAAGLAAPAWAGGESARVKAAVKKYLPVIRQLAAEKTVVADIEEQESQKMTPEQAQKIQADWVQIGIADSVQPYLSKPSCATIKGYQDRLPTAVKFFTLDDQGNVVASLPKSHDFIHATEDKYIQCYNGGRGKVVVGKASIDVSTKIYSFQVSVPVLDGGRTVGVLVATLSLE